MFIFARAFLGMNSSD